MQGTRGGGLAGVTPIHAPPCSTLLSEASCFLTYFFALSQAPPEVLRNRAIRMPAGRGWGPRRGELQQPSTQHSKGCGGAHRQHGPASGMLLLGSTAQHSAGRRSTAQHGMAAAQRACHRCKHEEACHGLGPQHGLPRGGPERAEGDAHHAGRRHCQHPWLDHGTQRRGGHDGHAAARGGTREGAGRRWGEWQAGVRGGSSGGLVRAWRRPRIPPCHSAARKQVLPSPRILFASPRVVGLLGEVHDAGPLGKLAAHLVHNLLLACTARGGCRGACDELNCGGKLCRVASGCSAAPRATLVGPRGAGRKGAPRAGQQPAAASWSLPSSGHAAAARPHLRGAAHRHE